MRRIAVSLLAGIVLLSGCASMDRPMQTSIDTMRVAQVEAAAKAVGVQVYWVNYPQKSSN